MHASSSANWLIVSYHYYSTNGIAPSPPIQTHTSHDPSFLCDEGLTRETSSSRWKFYPYQLAWHESFRTLSTFHTLIDPSVLSRPLIDQARSCWHNHTLSQFSQHTPSHARCKWSHLRLDIAHFALHSTRKTIKVVSICLLLCILEEALEKADAASLRQAA